jgi:hypothetical protein
MKKIKFIDLIRANIDSIDKTRKIHPLVIEHEITPIYNDLIIDAYVKGAINLSMVVRKYGLTHTIDVTEDAITGEYYSILPQEVIPIPFAGGGVKEIYAKTSQSLAFVPMNHDELKIIDGLEVQSVDDVIGYTLYAGQAGEVGRVVYTGMTSDVADAGVIMGLIIPFHAYDDDDYVYFPPKGEQAVMDAVLQRLGLVPAPDLVNNNSDTKRVKQ